MNRQEFVHTLVDKINRVFTGPEIVADRCVHSRIEISDCRRCADNCPSGAWIINDDMLAIDTHACDACGLCVAVCTEQALYMSNDIEHPCFENELVAAAICNNAKPTATPDRGAVTCLHALSLIELVKLYVGGVRHLLVGHGDCQKCSYGNCSETLFERISLLNNLLSNRNLPLMQLRHVPSSEWHKRHEILRDIPLEQSALSRRFFFNKLYQKAIVDSTESHIDGASAYVSLGKLLPQKNPDKLHFFVPEFDRNLCRACDNCTLVCQPKAITIQEKPCGYRIDSELCTNCGLCMEICDYDAIQVTPWSIQSCQFVEIESYRCRSCGTDFHLNPIQHSFIDSESELSELCIICEKVDHHKNLFQVLS